jgi:Zn-finger nucleic acid-binding protein
MNCPRDNTALIPEPQLGIEIDRCPTCNGRWLDSGELDQLEATVPSTEAERRATIEYGEIKSELKCPKCEKQMTQFNYRAYELELDFCPDDHGYWLDSGEDGRVRDIIAERVRDLARSAEAEAGWSSFLGGLKRGKKGLFGR